MASVFGFIDLMLAMIVLASAGLPGVMLIIAALYLIIRGLFYMLISDHPRLLDLGIGVLLLFATASLHSAVATILSSLMLSVKGILRVY